ncbi:hypothetical protein [Paenibacillus arenosi]|uniref:Uncharacterized protein n=1 Tax=Paenibacillus arenosi TaxID=2774142 RepID=A0ABR9AXU7_9BACL|nr:hypothetical protein [Paenibacillus arenosi]MBD8498469.1 hypothetical protein [Paenibacillus arenosi]
MLHYARSFLISCYDDSAKLLFSPIIAGFLLSITTIDTILIINIGTFLIALVAVIVVMQGLQVAAKEFTSQFFVKELAKGWRGMQSLLNKGVLLLVMLVSLV